MNLIKLFIVKRSYAYILLILSFLVGVYSFYQIKKELLPSQKLFFFNVETTYQNFPPFIIEKIITKPLEERLGALKNIKSLTSVSDQGKSSIFLTFDSDSSYESILIDLYETIDKFSLHLPNDSHKPQVFNYDPNAKPEFIYSYSSSSINPNQIREYLEKKLVPKIKRISGVANVEVYGGNLKELNIKLTEKYVDIIPQIDQVVHQRLVSENFFTLLGSIENGLNTSPYFVFNRFQTPEEIKSILVSIQKDESLIKNLFLKDLAKIQNLNKARNSLSLINNAPNVSLTVFINKNASILSVGKRIEEQLKKEHQVLEGFFNSEVKIINVVNTYKQINQKLNQLYLSIILGGLILFVFIFLSMKDYKKSIIVLLGIPFSLAWMIFFLKLFDYSINLFTLVGTTIVSGLLVDVSLMLLDQYNEKRFKNQEEKESYIYIQTIKVLKPLFIGFVTSIVIFVPIIFAPKEIKDQFEDIAVTISLGLLFSFLYSILILPPLVIDWVNKFQQDKKVYLYQLYLFFQMRFWKFRKIIFALLLAYTSILIGILFISSQYDIFKLKPKNKIFVKYEFNPGIKLSIMEKESKKIAKELNEVSKNIKNTFLKVSKYRTDLTIELDSSKTTTEELVKIKKWIDENKALVKYGYLHLENTSSKSEEKQIDLKMDLIGLDYFEIEKQIHQAVEFIQQSGLVESISFHFRRDFKEFILEFDKTKIYELNLTPSDISRKIQLKKEGYIPTKYIGKNKNQDLLNENDIRIMSVQKTKGSLLELLQSEISTPSGPVKFGSLVTVKSIFAMSKRYRKNKNKVLSFTVRSQPGYSYSDFYYKIEKIAQSIQLPERYFLEIDDSLNVKTLIFFVTLYFLVIIYLIYMCCASVYRSFTKPFILIMALIITLAAPLTIVGINGGVFNLPIIIGLAIVIGLGINNYCIIIDEIDKLKFETDNSFSLIINSFINRKKSIIISTGSTFFALIPGLFSPNQFYSSLALILMSGLLWNLFLSVFIFPSYYVHFQRPSKKYIMNSSQ